MEGRLGDSDNFSGPTWSSQVELIVEHHQDQLHLSSKVMTKELVPSWNKTVDFRRQSRRQTCSKGLNTET